MVQSYGGEAFLPHARTREVFDRVKKWFEARGGRVSVSVWDAREEGPGVQRFFVDQGTVPYPSPSTADSEKVFAFNTWTIDGRVLMRFRITPRIPERDLEIPDPEAAMSSWVRFLEPLWLVLGLLEYPKLMSLSDYDALPGEALVAGRSEEVARLRAEMAKPRRKVRVVSPTSAANLVELVLRRLRSLPSAIVAFSPETLAMKGEFERGIFEAYPEGDLALRLDGTRLKGEDSFNDVWTELLDTGHQVNGLDCLNDHLVDAMLGYVGAMPSRALVLWTDLEVTLDARLNSASSELEFLLEWARNCSTAEAGSRIKSPFHFVMTGAWVGLDREIEHERSFLSRASAGAWILHVGPMGAEGDPDPTFPEDAAAVRDEIA